MNRAKATIPTAEAMFTYTDVTGYDATTDTNTVTTDTVAIDVILSNYELGEISDTVLQTDLKCRVLTDDIISISVTPSKHDTFVINSIKYTIESVTKDSQDISRVFQLRA